MKNEKLVAAALQLAPGVDVVGWTFSSPFVRIAFRAHDDRALHGLLKLAAKVNAMATVFEHSEDEIRYILSFDARSQELVLLEAARKRNSP